MRASPQSASEQSANGGLLICGDVDMPDSVSKFARELGDNPPMLGVTPTASNRADDSDDLASTIELWAILGIKTIVSFHARDRKIADSAKFVARLKSSSTVSIGSG